MDDVSVFIESGLGLHSGFLTMTYWMNGILILGLVLSAIIFIRDELAYARKEGMSISEWLKAEKNHPDAPWNKKKNQ